MKYYLEYYIDKNRQLNNYQNKKYGKIDIAELFNNYKTKCLTNYKIKDDLEILKVRI